jgi:hypothetical protein
MALPPAGPSETLATTEWYDLTLREDQGLFRKKGTICFSRPPDKANNKAAGKRRTPKGVWSAALSRRFCLLFATG